VQAFLTPEQFETLLKECGKQDEKIVNFGLKVLEEYLKTPVKELGSESKVRPKRYTECISLYVSEEMYDEIINRANKSNSSIASVIRDAIKHYFASQTS